MTWLVLLAWRNQGSVFVAISQPWLLISYDCFVYVGAYYPHFEPLVRGDSRCVRMDSPLVPIDIISQRCRVIQHG